MSTNPAPQTVVAALVAAGLVDRASTTEAERVVAASLSPTTTTTAPLRRRMAEIAGYVGGAFVVGAAALFFAGHWSSLGRPAQVALLGGIAVVLAAACMALVVLAGGPAAVRRPEQQVRRRLASVLAAGAATAAGFAVGLLADNPGVYTDDTRAALLGAAAALLVALAGYRAAPSVVGQAAAAAAAFAMIPTGLDAFASVTPVAFGGLALALGVVWLILTELGVWLEERAGRVLGCLLALLGAQIPVVSDERAWVGYVATAVVGVAAFGGYVVRREWPYLALGVASVTLAVPESLSDWTNGSLGSAGVLLVAGVTLLVASLLGLRLRHEVAGAGRALT